MCISNSLQRKYHDGGSILQKGDSDKRKKLPFKSSNTSDKKLPGISAEPNKQDNAAEHNQEKHSVTLLRLEGHRCSISLALKRVSVSCILRISNLIGGDLE